MNVDADGDNDSETMDTEIEFQNHCLKLGS